MESEAGVHREPRARAEEMSEGGFWKGLWFHFVQSTGVHNTVWPVLSVDDDEQIQQ